LPAGWLAVWRSGCDSAGACRWRKRSLRCRTVGMGGLVDSAGTLEDMVHALRIMATPLSYLVLLLLLLLLLPGLESPLPPALLEQLQGGSSSQHGSGDDQHGLQSGSQAALGEHSLRPALHLCCGSVLCSCQPAMPAAITAVPASNRGPYVQLVDSMVGAMHFICVVTLLELQLKLMRTAMCRHWMRAQLHRPAV
jgi:hypothetical protein